MKEYFVALSVFLFMASQLIAYDPFKDQQQHQQTLQDPENLSRPTTNTLKGAEIKEFRDKLNAAKAQVFKEGSALGGARFRAQTEDVAGNRFQAEAPIGHFNALVQSQIISKFPDAKDATRPVLVDMTIDGQTVRVDSAKLADSPAVLSQAVIPAKAGIQSVNNPLVKSNSLPAALGGVRRNDVPTAIVPRLEAPKPSAVTNSLRGSQPPATASPPAIPGKAGIQSVGNLVQKNNSLSAAADGFRRNDDHRNDGLVKSAPIAVSARPDISKVAQSLAGEPVNVMRAAAPVAIIPLVGGPALTVVSVKNSPADSTVTVEVHGTAQALPQAIKDQIKTDVPDAAQVLTQKGDVAVVMTIRPDNTIAVVSVAVIPAKAGIQSVDNSDKKDNSLSAAAGGFRRNDGKAVAASKSETRLMDAAKGLASFVGSDPKTVRIENRSTPVSLANPMPSVVLTLENGGEISVRELSNDPKSEKTLYQAESKFKDLSLEMKGQILAKLADFGGETLVNDETQVKIDFALQSDEKPTFAESAVGRPVVTQIAIKSKDAALGQTVVLFKQNGTLQAPAQGLAPAAARLIRAGFGIEKGKFNIKDISANGTVRVEAQRGNSPDKKNILLTWMPEVISGQYEFSAQGKPLDFSDAIREAIYAKLREAVENGESWATEALKGKKEIVVEFEPVEEGTEEVEKLKIKSVSLSTRDAAVEFAQNLGLAEGDYQLINTGTQMLVALEKGKVGTLKVGDKFVQLKSSDGEAKVFVKQTRAKNEIGVLLMLSRESLEENRDALVRLTGKDGIEIINQALQNNAKTGQFLVRVDPNAEEKLFIKPIAPPAKEDVKK